MFKRKLTDEELNGLEWNIEGICKSPSLHAQLMAMVDRAFPLPDDTPRRKNWLRFWGRRNRKTGEG